MACDAHDCGRFCQIPARFRPIPGPNRADWTLPCRPGKGQENCKVRLARHKSFRDRRAPTTVSGVTARPEDFAILLREGGQRRRGRRPTRPPRTVARRSLRRRLRKAAQQRRFEAPARRGTTAGRRSASNVRARRITSRVAQMQAASARRSQGNSCQTPCLSCCGGVRFAPICFKEGVSIRLRSAGILGMELYPIPESDP
jgi:hypothetical protein